MELVSVIIPCYNAERWVAEAIQSSLTQTHAPIEIVVVDDGSTDRSLEIIKSFGNRIRWETGPNRGGNHARNRGLALTTGKFVQFLDADDYILPEKIARQAALMEQSDADLVYGDWRHEFHEGDPKPRLGDIVRPGEQRDLLRALLRRWWVPPVAILFRRAAVERAGGWDESLRAAQDTGLMVSLGLSGGVARYQPGCASIYRRYGAVTVSTSNLDRWLRCHQRVLEGAVDRMRANGSLDVYRVEVAGCYFNLARNYYELDRTMFRMNLAMALKIWPEFKPDGSWWYKTTQGIVGYEVAEYLAHRKRKIGAAAASGLELRAKAKT